MRTSALAGQSPDDLASALAAKAATESRLAKLARAPALQPVKNVIEYIHRNIFNFDGDTKTFSDDPTRSVSELSPFAWVRIGLHACVLELIVGTHVKILSSVRNDTRTSSPCSPNSLTRRYSDRDLLRHSLRRASLELQRSRNPCTLPHLLRLRHQL